MRGIHLALSIALFTVGLMGSSSYAQVLGPQFIPTEQLLVLKNGEIMRGQITRNADQVIIVEHGSRLVLLADKTDFVCNSMDEAYWGKLARTKASDLAGQKDLFEWCIKNKMLNHAQNQIDILLQSKAKASELEYLDRQLNVALIQQRNSERRLAQGSDPGKQFQSAKPSAGQPNSSIDPSPAESQMAFVPIELDATIGSGDSESNLMEEPIFRPLPSLNPDDSSTDSQFFGLPPMKMLSNETDSEASVRQVGFEEEVEFETISLAHKVPSETPSFDSTQAIEQVDDRIMTSIRDLDRETRSMPDGSVGHYRTRVERVLTNGCSAAKCHSADSRIMPLMQLSRGQPIPRRQSQRNLHNVLKYVDRAKPFESRMFLAATMPHAGNAEPILESGSTQRENLMRWLIMLGDNPEQALHEAVQSERKAAMPLEESAVKTYADPIESEMVGLNSKANSSVDFPETIGEIPKLDAVDSGFTPVDPFDPEVFNRKFGK